MNYDTRTPSRQDDRSARARMTSHHQRALDSLVELIDQVMHPGWSGEVCLRLVIDNGNLRDEYQEVKRKTTRKID